MKSSRKLVSALAGLTLIVGLAIAPASAWADQTITTQPDYAASGIKALHAQGLDGSGIKIAIIDGPVDTSVPELRGVKVITKSFCKTKFAPSSVAHATAIASILASPDYGWAPKATILNYTTATIYDEFGDCDPAYIGDDLGFVINQALNDGADVISISIEWKGGITGIAPYALIRAANLGVPVVAGVGNDNISIDSSGLAAANTVIAVGAIDGTSRKASYSNYGTGLDLMAYGGPPLTVRDPDKAGNLTVITKNRWGTSLATPMVAGALALAKQKWPNASGNQLERVLLDTADGKADHHVNWTEKMGYGTLNAKLLVATDPSGYSDENPNLTKNDIAPPQAADFQAYNNGTVDPNDTLGDNSYTYRGCNQAILNNLPDGAKAEPGPACQTASPSPSNPAPTTTPTSPPPTPPSDTATGILWLPIGIAAGIIIIIAVIVIIIATRRKRPPTQIPPVQQAWPTPQQPYPQYPGGPPTGYPA